ncbi:alpha/beta hydrolase [Rosettibacter firmus]|uniref:alpha/beta hydrolase n=1 Tax=Rosettibacter firmus TaxID=3111522 RepID=UPI00336BBCB2
MIYIKKILFTIFIIVFVTNFYAQENKIKIWNGLAPGTGDTLNNETYVDGRFRNIYQPELTAFLLDNRTINTPTIIIFPGGGYTHLAYEKEGLKVAKFLNSNGINAFILKYRLNENLALIDAQRAVKFIRAKAREFNINPDKIGIMGFSAGGHLAANMIISENKNYINDNIDSMNHIPNFVVLIYPWLQNLYKEVKNTFPPTFFIHASDDTRVPVEQSINFYNELIKKNTNVEMHIYNKGGHGFGMEKERGRSASWGNIFLEWLNSIEY